MPIWNSLGLKLYSDDLLFYKPIGIWKAEQFTYVDRTDVLKLYYVIVTALSASESPFCKCRLIGLHIFCNILKYFIP